MAVTSQYSNSLLTNFTLGDPETITSFPYTPTQNGILYISFVSSDAGGFYTINNGFYIITEYLTEAGFAGFLSILGFKDTALSIVGTTNVASYSYKYFPFKNPS